MYDREFECADITEEELTLITSRLLESLKGVINSWPRTRRIVSCDPDASINGDECVIYAMENYKVIDEDIFHERDTDKIAFRIDLMCEKHDIPDCIVDSIGVGKGVYDQLVKKKNRRVRGFDSRERAYDPKRFLNGRAEAWWYTMGLMMEKKVSYPEDIMLRQDLTAVRVEPDKSRLQLENKVLGTKKRLGRSPDRGDTFVMGVYGSQMVPDVELYQTEDERQSEMAESYTVESAFG